MFVYAMLCKNTKYYIGKSKNVEKRFKDHKAGKGAVWTRLNEPIEIIECMETIDPFEEDKIVKKYMLKHGIDNVRGGSYSQVELQDFQLRSLKREIWHAENKCLKCGRSGHFVMKCKENKDVDGNILKPVLI